MKGFILQPTYRIIEGKPIVQLYGTLENGESFRADFDCVPYFFIKRDDLKKAKEATDYPFDIKDEGFATFAGESATKIILKSPRDVPKLRKDFEHQGIFCYEADVRFAYRFLFDHDLKGGIEITGEHTAGERVKRIYANPKIAAIHHVPELRVLSLDIETTGDASQIYCIAISGMGMRNVLLAADKHHAKQQEKQEKKFEHAETFSSEEAMLSRFLEIIREKDPDVLTGWNVIDFDLNVIGKRCKFHKLPFVLGRSEESVEITIQRDFFRESTAEIPGRVVLDGIHLLKTSFITLEDYRLDTAAHEILGESKLVAFHDKRKEIEDMYKKDPQKLVDYNLQDADLVLRIIEKTKVLDLTIERAMLSGMPLDRVRASIASLDSLYLREARHRKLVCPSGSFSDREERIKGGFVRDSVPGIYDNIIVFDFKSLYPSVMRTFNIDPASFAPDDRDLTKSHDPKKFVRCANGAFFRNDEGILPMILQQLWEAREKARKAKNELARQSIKILMNSFFGVLASPLCRFYNLKIANAITHTSQYVIKLTAEKMKESGYAVIYGDTDSVFIKSGCKTLEEANKVGKKLASEINEFYATMIKKEYHRESFLELEFEHVFTKFIMPTIRGSETGAKKRYAGLIEKNGKEEMEFTGLEAVRSDWTDLAREFQTKLLRQIFDSKDPGKYIRALVEDLHAGKLDDQLMYHKRIRKDLEEYTKTTPPHVKAARLLPQITSDVIYYVMTVKGPEPQGYVKHKLDYDHYIEKQLKPIADSILSFQGKKFDDFVGKGGQKSLEGF